MTLQERIAALRAGQPPAQPPAPAPVAPVSVPMTLRPERLTDIICQRPIIEKLARFAKQPHSQAFLFHGETGIGKTATALALAREMGAVDDLSGLRIIASGEQSADAVRECISGMHLYPMMNDWHVTIVNECDRMSKQAETIWLDALESLPPHAVVIFTTNHVDSLTDRFRDRCICFAFASEAKAMQSEAVAWVRANAATLDASSIVREAIIEGRLSLRRVVAGIKAAMM